jgi:hypothetical protein
MFIYYKKSEHNLKLNEILDIIAKYVHFVIKNGHVTMLGSIIGRVQIPFEFLRAAYAFVIRASEETRPHCRYKPYKTAADGFATALFRCKDAAPDLKK